jgi:hypothetical protein
MRAHYIFILDELLNRKPIVAPDNINGDVTPRFAWNAGYLAAIEAILEAFQSNPDKDSVQ